MPQQISHSDDQSNDEPDTALKLKVFTGSWNMAAKDPFADKKGEYIGDALAASSLSEFLPLGYDLYVIGTQEKVSKHLHSAVLARLNARVGGSTTQKMAQNSASSSAPSRHHHHHHRQSHRVQPSTARDATTTARASATASWTRCFARARLDSSVAARRATAPAALTRGSPRPSSAPLPQPLQETQQQEHPHESKSEAESIAIYVAVRLEPAVEVVRVGAHKFSFTSGSKGGLAVMLRFAGDQTLTLVNCHLESNCPALRRQQLESLAKKLPKAMGLEDNHDSRMDLASCSDHVVWMGDFNYRIHSLDGETVLKLLGSNRHMELHDRYDSMKDDMDFVAGMRRFKEPQKWSTFYPTYKKPPNRPSSVSMTASNPSWPLQVYRVRYKEPLYKGGQVKARVPGWCDRILHCSAPAWRSYLEVEKVPCGLGDAASRVLAGDGQLESGSLQENYRSVDDTLRGSDHSPVFCTFLWTVTAAAGGGGTADEPIMEITISSISRHLETSRKQTTQRAGRSRVL